MRTNTHLPNNALAHTPPCGQICPVLLLPLPVATDAANADKGNTAHAASSYNEGKKRGVSDDEDEPGERERVLVANTTLLTWLVLVLL